MHEWIPVVCGMVLHWSRTRPDARWAVLLRIVVVAMVVMLGAGEVRTAPSSLPLDLLLVATGMGAAMLITRARHRRWTRRRQPLASMR